MFLHAWPQIADSDQLLVPCTRKHEHSVQSLVHQAQFLAISSTKHQSWCYITHRRAYFRFTAVTEVSFRAHGAATAAVPGSRR